MIKATFYKKSDGAYKGFSVKGHADFDNSGKDIVCAAVSALTINTINSVDSLTDNTFEINDGKSGLLEFKFTSHSDEKGQLLLNSLALGITGIQKEYGEKYLQVYFKEV